MSPERMSAEQGERCQLCGSLVEVVSSDEGTSCYRPAEQGDAICIHCGAEVFWGLPLPEDPCFECGKPVAEQGDVEAFECCLDHEKHTWKCARENLLAALERAERERDEARANADGMARAPYGEFEKMRKERDAALDAAEYAIATGQTAAVGWLADKDRAASAEAQLAERDKRIEKAELALAEAIAAHSLHVQEDGKVHYCPICDRAGSATAAVIRRVAEDESHGPAPLARDPEWPAQEC